jgi:hypothetical protein
MVLIYNNYSDENNSVQCFQIHADYCILQPYHYNETSGRLNMLRPAALIGVAVAGAAIGTFFARRNQTTINPQPANNHLAPIPPTNNNLPAPPETLLTKVRRREFLELPKQNNIVILAAPGKQCYDGKLVQNAVEAFTAQGLSVTQIGDGLTPLAEADIHKLHETLRGQDRPLLFIFARGKTYQYDEDPGLYLDGETATSTSDFFKTMKQQLSDKSVDVISLAGNDQVFARYATDYLPSGSSYFSLSPFHGWYGGAAEIFDKLKTCNYFHGDLSPQKFLIAYLALNRNLYREGDDSVQVQVTNQDKITVEHVSLPIFARCGLPPLEVMGNYAFGTRMSDFDRDVIHDQLSRFATDAELNNLIQQIEVGSYKDFVNNPNYGLVHAMCYVTHTYYRCNLNKSWNKDIAPVMVAGEENQAQIRPHQ